MGFGAGLGAFTSGIDQGQNQQADLRQKMLQIQQFQMLLDNQKKQIAAQAAYGNALGAPPPSTGGAPSGAPGGPQAPQPTPPGAPPSSPWQMAPRPQPGGVPMPTPNPMRVPQPQPPAGGAPQGAMPAPPGGMAPQQPPQGVGQGGGLQQLTQALNSGQMDPAQAIQGIAARIKAANPGIDPQTLEMATEQAVGLMHQIGLDPATKLQMQLLLGQQRGEFAQERTDTQQAGATQRTEMQQSGATGRTEMQQSGATGREGMRDQTSIQTAQMRITDAEKRLQSTLTAANARFQQGRGDRVSYQAQMMRARALSGELSAAKAELSAAVNAATPDQTKIDAAMAKVDAVEKKLKILEGAVGQPKQSGAARPAANPVIGPGRQPSATVQQGAKGIPSPAALDQMIARQGIDAAIASAPNDAVAQALTDRYEKTHNIGPNRKAAQPKTVNFSQLPAQ